MRSARDLRAALRVLCDEIDRSVAWRLGAVALLIVAGGLLAGLAPLALKGLVDAVGGAQDNAGRYKAFSATVLGALYLAAVCGGRLLAEARPPLVGAVEQRIYARLRRRCFMHLLALPMAFHIGRQTGSLVHSLQQAITGYQIIVFSLVNSLVPVLVELTTVAFVLASLKQTALMASFSVTALAYVAVVAHSTFQLKNSAHAVARASLDARALFADGLLNVETIKCFGAEGRVGGEFADATEALEARWTGLHRDRARMGAAMVMTFALAMTTSLVIAVHAVSEGTLSVGGFVLANVYMLQVIRPLEMLGAAARDLSQALEFIRPLLDILQEPASHPRAPQRPSTPSLPCGSNGSAKSRVEADSAFANRRHPPAISFRDVHFAYDADTPVLQGLNLDIAAGRTVGIVGGSGCGKSSLVRLLLGLYEPRTGAILLDGVAIDTLPVDALRSLIGVVPQDTALFNASIGFNIGIGQAGAAQFDIEQAARLVQLHHFVASLPAGYDTVVGERGLKLSGGERQRIAIARAVIKRPLVYVFDEATSMLDNLTEVAILRHLHEVSAGCTTITIAHRLSTIRHADEIVVLDAGRVVEQGTHEVLLGNGGHYARLWEAQSRAGLEGAP